ncbi:calcium-binding protein, partial [Hoeflea sp.]|uniref:beta strand repeat-containing protein n=1 Tax=Hoeflea sp. TaxID=1940281 RepID=UPI0019C72C20
MTTYSAVGFSFRIDEITNTVSSFTPGTTFDVVTNEADSTFSYIVDASPSGLDEVTVNYSAYNVRINGNDIASLNGGNLPYAEFGTITWNNGGGVKTSYILVLSDASTSNDHLVVVGGDPLPSFSNAAEFNVFYSSQIISLSSAPSGSGFGPGEAISYASVPGATFSQNDRVFAYPDGGLIETGSGNDEIFGNSGNDIINPGDNAEYDFIQGSSGNDTIIYSQNFNGSQNLSYENLDGGISVTINGSTNTGSVNKGPNGTDTITDVANPLNAGFFNGGFGLRGTNHNDAFNLTLNFNQWMGVSGGRGVDTIGVQGPGLVRLDYRGGDNGINVNLASGVVSNDGFGNVESLSGSFWEVRGTDFADSIVGSDGGESFIGLGGNDTIDGGGGSDRIRYDQGSIPSGVTVDLTAGTATGTVNGISFSHTLSNIEQVRGSAGNDVITGDAGNNRLWGRGGNDTLNGGDGSDELYGEDGNDIINPGDNTDYDYIEGSSGNDQILYTDSLGGFQNLNYGFLNTAISATVNGITNTASVNKGANGLDTIMDIANPLNAGFTVIGGFGLQGTNQNDTFNLTLNSNQWMFVAGGRGVDSITVQGGNLGLVRLDYGAGETGINVNLATGAVANDGFGNAETVSGTFWEVRATNHDDTIVGSAANESFIAQAGNDIIDGGGGIDRIRFENLNTSGGVNVNLAAGTATGTINGLAFSYTLSNIEDVRGSRTGDDTITGSNADNNLRGYGGNDTLDGGLGNDTLDGGDGNDTYVVDNTGDTIVETASQGTDTVLSSVSYALYLQGQHIENLTLTGSANINGTGNGLANTITGNAGSNGLNGGGGADIMIGGAGNDTYHVDTAGDVIVELGNEGIDTVMSSVTYALYLQGQHIENLTLTGTGNIHAVGNTLDNVITGNSGANTLTGGAGNDTLNGGAGADTLVGGTGSDAYIVDNFGDTIVEAANEGADVVLSSVTYALYLQGQHIENLTLTGTGNINGIGNSLGNILTGNAGINTL